MRLEHEFSVPAPPDVVWAAVTDPERVAPCMPGASLTSVEGPVFAGGVKVKLGPVSLLYKGSGEFLETDEQARRVVIKAAGKDSRGNGTASATVTVTLSPEGAGTKGTVSTDLTITGKPAQFGRGLIIEVGGKILDVFAACLAKKLGDEGEADPGGPAPPAAGPAAAAGPADAADEDDEPAAGQPKPARRRTATKPAAEAEPDGSVNGVPASAEDSPRLQLVDEAAAAAGAAKPAAPRPAPAASETEAIDLLDYAGASVAKRLIPVLAAVLVAIVVWRLRRR